MRTLFMHSVSTIFFYDNRGYVNKGIKFQLCINLASKPQPAINIVSLFVYGVLIRRYSVATFQ